MAVHELSFEPKNDKGNNPGDYDLFLDLQGGDTVLFVIPNGFSIAGIKIYSAQEPGGAGAPLATPPQKTSDMNRCRRGDYSAFENWPEHLPEGFAAVVPSPGVVTGITYSGTTVGFYEYLIWISKPDGAGGLVNDFIDPGLRNKGQGGTT